MSNASITFIRCYSADFYWRACSIPVDALLAFSLSSSASSTAGTTARCFLQAQLSIFLLLLEGDYLPLPVLPFLSTTLFSRLLAIPAIRFPRTPIPPTSFRASCFTSNKVPRYKAVPRWTLSQSPTHDPIYLWMMVRGLAADSRIEESLLHMKASNGKTGVIRLIK